MIKRGFILLLLALLILALSLFLFEKSQNKLCFNNHCFVVELAKTEQEWARGLMFRESMAPDKGMLFVFEEEKEHSFWMKNTLIPLDIVWLNRDKEVVFIAKNSQPCKTENCEIIIPTEKAKYVLELNAGIVDEINLKIGNRLEFKINDQSL